MIQYKSDAAGWAPTPSQAVAVNTIMPSSIIWY